MSRNATCVFADSVRICKYEVIVSSSPPYILAWVCGGSIIMAWALVPLNPKAFTLAVSGVPSFLWKSSYRTLVKSCDFLAYFAKHINRVLVPQLLPGTRVHFMFSWGITIGTSWMFFISGFSFVKCFSLGIVSCCMHKITFMTLDIPAAASVCPIYGCDQSSHRSSATVIWRLQRSLIESKNGWFSHSQLETLSNDLWLANLLLYNNFII